MDVSVYVSHCVSLQVWGLCFAISQPIGLPIHISCQPSLRLIQFILCTESSMCLVYLSLSILSVFYNANYLARHFLHLGIVPRP